MEIMTSTGMSLLPPTQKAGVTRIGVDTPPIAGWDRLGTEDRELLVRLLEEPTEYVHHELFDKADAEQILFGRTAEQMHDVSHFAEDGTLAAGQNGKESHLTTAQEVLLFQRYNYARMQLTRLATWDGPKAFSFEEACLLAAWGRRAAAIRTQIVQANMPLVLAMAKRTRLAGLDPNEMISEGNLALLRSVDKFDCSRGFKFSTYACRAILKSFSRVAMRTARYRGHFPTEFDPSLEKGDFEDRKREDVESRCVQEVQEIMTENRASLSDVERTVIRERFALTAHNSQVKGKTLEQVGTMVGLTKERVRQIQNKALGKLRAVLEEDYLKT
jgi:RNA polymerase sigma factor (sigma-70 family)